MNGNSCLIIRWKTKEAKDEDDLNGDDDDDIEIWTWLREDKIKKNPTAEKVRKKRNNLKSVIIIFS